MKSTMKMTALAVLMGTILAGCSLDGDDGAQGTQGPQGEQGLPGQDGNDGQNAALGLDIVQIGRAALGVESSEGAAEIVQYHATSQTVFAVNSSGDEPMVSIIDVSGLTSEALSNPLTSTNLTPSTLMLESSYEKGTDTIALGDANSLAVHGNWLAVAMAADEKTDNGAILFYEIIDAGAPYFVKAVEVGNLPDMLTFSPDGSKVVVANEGEPSGDYNLDPQGTIAVIDMVDGQPADSATLIDFTAFNGMQAELEAKGMRFSNPTGRTINGTAINISVAQDIEPEYLTIKGDKAYVTLQENNGLAIVDLTDNSVELVGLGFKDWSGLDIDVSDKDGGMNFQRFENLYGVYMPDTITSYTWNDATFLITANEGDAREYFFDVVDEADCTAKGGVDYDEDDGCLAFIDEVRFKDLEMDPDSPLAVNYDKDVLGRLNVMPDLGDADGDGLYESAYAFGGRSMSIWDSNGLQVFDSGDDVGRITASMHGQAFNNNEDENEGDTRSDSKGAEPEAVAVGQVGDRMYAFLGLERMGGVMVYDVTNPFDVQFKEYFINRDTTEGAEPMGDLAPEGFAFVPAEQSPTGEALLIIGNEISGTVAVWQVSAK